MFTNRDIVLLSGHANDVSQFRTPQEKCREGRPIQTFHRHFESVDLLFSVGVWECGVGSFTVNFTGHEFAHLLEGKLMLEDQQGAKQIFNAGMQFMIPAGYQGVLTVLERAKKTYVWHELGPASI